MQLEKKKKEIETKVNRKKLDDAKVKYSQFCAANPQIRSYYERMVEYYEKTDDFLVASDYHLETKIAAMEVVEENLVEQIRTEERIASQNVDSCRAQVSKCYRAAEQARKAHNDYCRNHGLPSRAPSSGSARMMGMRPDQFSEFMRGHQQTKSAQVVNQQTPKTIDFDD